MTSAVSPLALSGVSVRFGGIQALENVSINVEAGEIVAVIGPNGAGKSSLINVVTGFYKPSPGEVVVGGGRGAVPARTVTAARGVARTSQPPGLIGSLSCLGTLLPAFHGAARRYAWGIGNRSQEQITRQCIEILDEAGLKNRYNENTDSLSLGEQRRLELARSCVSNPKVLLLDEIASGLAEIEAKSIIPVIRKMARERGAAVVLVEHSMAFVRETADRVVVLVKGQVVARGGVVETLSNPRVIEAYLGTSNDAQ